MQVGKWTANIEDQVEGIVRAIAIELFSSVILDSPVDTGRLRGNWRISLNSPKEGTVKILDPDGSTSIRKVEDTVYGANIVGKDIEFFLSNSLPYAAMIEFDGHSNQAPGGMVRKNAIRIAQNVKRQYG